MRRKGDDRPLVHGAPLAVLPRRPFRWLPRHGQPFCVGEWATQHAVRTLARPAVYFATFALLAVIVTVFGLPFVAA